jgi:hypothetical protein
VPPHVKIALWTVFANFWGPSKVLTIKLKYSTGRFSAKYDIFLRNFQRALKMKQKDKTLNLLVNDQLPNIFFLI